MRKIFSLLAAVLFAGSMMAADAVIAKGTTNSYDDVTVNSEKAIKMGKSGAGGNMTITVGAGATSLSFYAAAWNNEDAQKVTITAPEGVTVTPAEITVSANANLAGNGKSFTVTPEADYAFTVTLSGATAETVLTLASEKRAFVWGATYEAGAAPAVATPVISGEAEFTDSVIVTITCSTPETDIYYTTDGTTDPKCDCSAAPEYKHEIVLKETTTIMAAAYTGNDWSAVATKTFTKKEPLPDTLSCAQAREAALNGMTDNVKVRGYVTEIAYAWKDGSMSFWMADSLNGGKVFEAYKCAIEKQEDAVSVGDLVVATGKLTKYNTTPELAEGCTVEIIEKTQILPQNLGEKTIAEFLSLKNTLDTCILTGVVDSIMNTTYGNLYLSDATAQLYIYGLLNAAGEAKKFAELGVAAGDTLTVLAVYNEHQGAPQAKNAVFVEVKKAPADTIALDFNVQNTTYAFVDNQYFGEYGTTDIYLSDINVNASTYEFEGDGNYLVLDFYPEDANNVTGIYKSEDETLDLEYTYMLTINGTDTAEVMFADAGIMVSIGQTDKERGVAELAIVGNLISTEGDIYLLSAAVIAYYDFLPEEQGVEDVVLDLKAIKKIINGQVIIEKNGVQYNVLGNTVK